MDIVMRKRDVLPLIKKLQWDIEHLVYVPRKSGEVIISSFLDGNTKITSGIILDKPPSEREFMEEFLIRVNESLKDLKLDDAADAAVTILETVGRVTKIYE